MFEIVRRDRLRFPEAPNVRVANCRFDAYYAQFLPVPVSSARPHAHPGIEFLYAITGKLVLQVSDEPQRAA